jgi:hypothetical protein
MRAPFLPILLLGFSALGSGCVAESPPVIVAAPGAPSVAAQQPALAQQGCREFNTPVTVGGQQQQAYGTACLQPDGSWRIEQHVADQPPQTYVVSPQVYRAYYPPDYVTDPWFYGPPLFVGGVFIGGGWGYLHGHAGWHGVWHPDWRRRWYGSVHGWR